MRDIARLRGALVATGMTLFVAGAAGWAGAADAGVSIANLAFVPSSVSVLAGDTVTWSNDDAVAHTVSADGGAFDSGTLASGGTFAVTFDSAGTFAYHCEIHPAMTGSVSVDPAGGAGGGGTPQTATLLPLLALGGAILLGAGLWLGRRRAAA